MWRGWLNQEHGGNKIFYLLFLQEETPIFIDPDIYKPSENKDNIPLMDYNLTFILIWVSGLFKKCVKKYKKNT